MSQTNGHERHPGEKLAQLFSGYCLSQCVYVAAKLKIADLLKDGPRSATELAAQTGMHGPSLYRVLRALAGVGVFTELEDEKFTHNSCSELLRTDVIGSQHAMAVMMGEEHYHAYGELLYSVQTGKSGFKKIYGKGVFEYLSEHPAEAANFDAAMTSVHGRETSPMVEAYDFSGIGTLCDVGGGNGSVLTAILKANPNLHGIVFDLPGVIERAKANIQAAGLADRCQLVAGSFFDSVPKADAYIMRHIIHDWYDEPSTTILRNCRNALAGNPKGKVLVVEGIVPPPGVPAYTKLLDITMLVMPDGKERTEKEYHALFAAAGLKISRIVPTSAEISIIEGVVG